MVQNYLLILLNEQIVHNNVEKNMIINLEKLDKNTLVSKIYTNLLEVETKMKNITFDRSFLISNKHIKNGREWLLCQILSRFFL